MDATFLTDPAAEATTDFLELLSTHFLICNEKIPGNGEDCGLEAYTWQAGIMGVFDGCGGLGAKACAAISGKTEAYLASRAVGAAAKQWFDTCADVGGQWDANALKAQILEKLALCRRQAGDSGLKLRGTLIRPFPSTAALTAFQILEGKLVTQHIWAGDSRCYVLDSQGLGQISNDDIKGEDAMSNLSRDGALTNVISADARFGLHSAEFIPEQPCIMLCATDGCFGYVSTPMEFEWMILSSLAQAENAAHWQQRLSEDISRRSGDDQTLALAAFGFEDFAALQGYFAPRHEKIRAIVQACAADSSQKQDLWEAYKSGYYRYTAKKSDNDGTNPNQ